MRISKLRRKQKNFGRFNYVLAASMINRRRFGIYKLTSSKFISNDYDREINKQKASDQTEYF